MLFVQESVYTAFIVVYTHQGEPVYTVRSNLCVTSILIHTFYNHKKLAIATKKISVASSGESLTMSDQPRLQASSVKIAKFSVIAVLCLLSSIIIATRGQPRHALKVLPTSVGGQCPSVEERERARNEIHQLVNETVYDIADLSTHTSCGTSGWKRIAFINMTDTSYSCPTGPNLTSYSKRTCGRSHLGNFGCSSTTFDVGGLPYSQVCGRIKGYQFGSSDAFRQSYDRGIDGQYVSGVSLTHGRSGSREHIWTFAAGLSESDPYSPFIPYRCPCDTSNNDMVPSFVGNDYFCESGVNTAWIVSQHSKRFFPNDPLWDGHNCTNNSTCCEFNNPPWFTKTLNASTTNDIELRICTYQQKKYSDVPLELIELYVQ